MLLQILMLASFVIGGYQDLRERLVSDTVWIPAIVGVVLLFYFDFSQAGFLLVWVAIMGAIGFGFVWFGLLGEADGIALVLILALPYPSELLPLIFSIALASGVAILYLFLKGMLGKERIITIQQFKGEARWIPRAVIVGGERKEVAKDVNVSREEVEKITDEGAMVDVQYGIPDITFLMAGYIVYIVYLAVFQSGVLLSLP
ncbi:MAG: hypothetical protein ABSA72_10310 [Nitrososphaerales archaeon]